MEYPKEEKLNFLDSLFKLFIPKTNEGNPIDNHFGGKEYASSNVDPDLKIQPKIIENVPVPAKVKNPSPYTAAKTKKLTIIKNEKIREKYKRGYIKKVRGLDEITEVTFHSTAGGTFSGIQTWMYNGERAEEYYKGIALFHYLIGLKGEIAEIIPIDYGVYHSSCGWHDIKHTIGIEFVNKSSKNRNSITQKQYESLSYLVFDVLMKKCPNISRFATHNYNAVKFKKKPWNCPGLGYKFDYMDNELKKRGYVFKKYLDLRYDIKK